MLQVEEVEIVAPGLFDILFWIKSDNEILLQIDLVQVLKNIYDILVMMKHLVQIVECERENLV